MAVKYQQTYQQVWHNKCNMDFTNCLSNLYKKIKYSYNQNIILVSAILNYTIKIKKNLYLVDSFDIDVKISRKD